MTDLQLVTDRDERQMVTGDISPNNVKMASTNTEKNLKEMNLFDW